MTPDRKEVLSVVQVAALLGCSHQTVINLISRGHFPNAFKLDPNKKSVYRILKKDVDSFLKLRTLK